MQKIVPCLILLLIGLAPWCVMAETPVEKPNPVIIHPGEVLYATFEITGSDLKLQSVSKEKNDRAQLVLRMDLFNKKDGFQMLAVQSKFKKDLAYKAEMKMPGKNRGKETSVLPIMAGLASYESWPHPIEELTLYGFVLEPIKAQ